MYVVIIANVFAAVVFVAAFVRPVLLLRVVGGAVTLSCCHARRRVVWQGV